MDERVMQFRVGVMVLATLIIAAILVVLFGEAPNLMQGSYTIYIDFIEAPGVTKDTPVRKSGVLIGRVTNVQLKDQGGVRITARINSGIKIFSNEVCRISSQLLGDTYLEFYYAPHRGSAAPVTPASFTLAGDPQTPGSEPPGRGKPVEPGAILQGESAAAGLGMMREMQADLTRAIGSIAETSHNLNRVVTRFGNLLDRNETNINSILVQADQALGVIRSTFENANVLIGDPKLQANFSKAVNDAPRLLAEAREAVGQMRTSFNSFERNMQNLEQFTRPLGDNGEAIVKRLDRTMAGLDEVVGLLGQFGLAMNNPDGSLGRLIRSPDLYNNLNQAACRLNEVTQDLRPIINDARVFTDKIARHPETLGVRGALERRPGIK